MGASLYLKKGPTAVTSVFIVGQHGNITLGPKARAPCISVQPGASLCLRPDFLAADAETEIQVPEVCQAGRQPLGITAHWAVKGRQREPPNCIACSPAKASADLLRGGVALRS